MNPDLIEPIVHEAFVQRPQTETFRYFTDQFGDWWPREYTFSKSVLDCICLGKSVGEWCFERGPHGFRCDWGRILTWNAPSLVAFTWQIGPKGVLQPDPSLSSQVSIEFSEPTPGMSRVVLTHGHFERHGPDGVAYRAEMASEYGWPLLLKLFVAAASN
jgi:uncharacterized protein YndB with AHSA1/START domain